MLSTFSFFDSVVHWFENFSICLTTTFRSLRVFKPFVRKIVTNKVCTNSNNGEGAQIVPGPPRFGVHVYSSSIPIMNKHFFISVRKLFIVNFDCPASQFQYSTLKWNEGFHPIYLVLGYHTCLNIPNASYTLMDINNTTAF